MASGLSPAHLFLFSSHALIACAYALLRTPSFAPSHILPELLTQEHDLILLSALLAAQRARRCCSRMEVLSTALLYAQLCVGALLALSDARRAVSYALLLLTAWATLPPPPLPLTELGFSLLTPYELACLPRTSPALVFAAMGTSDPAAVPCAATLARPGAPLWFADLAAYPDLAPALGVDSTLLSLELPTILELFGDRRLPLKRGDKVETVVLSQSNLQSYFLGR